MVQKKESIPLQLLAMGLAFAVGILVSQQFCTPAPAPPEEMQCPPEETRIVEFCPREEVIEEEPEPQEPPPPPIREVRRETRGKALPESPPPVAPEQRQLLLSWALAQSSSIQSCPRDLGKTYRIAVTLHLDPSRTIQEVILNSDDDLPPSLSTCLKERIPRWRLPEDVLVAQDRIFFRLTL